MQLMPGTASRLGVANSFDPVDNVEGGTRYLRELLERYNFDLIKAFAAYNAGPRRVEQLMACLPITRLRLTSHVLFVISTGRNWQNEKQLPRNPPALKRVTHNIARQ